MTSLEIMENTSDWLIYRAFKNAFTLQTKLEGHPLPGIFVESSVGDIVRIPLKIWMWRPEQTSQHLHPTCKFCSVGRNVGTVWERWFHPKFRKKKKKITLDSVGWNLFQNKFFIQLLLPSNTKITCWIRLRRFSIQHPHFFAAILKTKEWMDIKMLDINVGWSSQTVKILHPIFHPNASNIAI